MNQTNQVEIIKHQDTGVTITGKILKTGRIGMFMVHSKQLGLGTSGPYAILKEAETRLASIEYQIKEREAIKAGRPWPPATKKSYAGHR